MNFDRPSVILVTSFAVLWLAAHLSAGFERRWRPLRDEERDTFKTILGATLTLLALIIGFTFSMAVSRYDQRKHYEEEEANAIGTEFLRAELLPAATADKVKQLLRSYTAQRVLFYEERRDDQLAQINERTGQLQREMWSAVESAAEIQPTPPVTLAAAGMNDVLNSQGYTQAIWWNRIPEGAWGLMAVIALACCVLTGYSANLARRSLLVILPLVLATAFFFIADVDSPRHGLIRVIPQNLLATAEGIK